MTHLAVVLHVLGLRATDYLTSQVRVARSLTKRDERGSVTIENVVWAVAVIGIAAIAVFAVTSFVNAQVGKLR